VDKEEGDPSNDTPNKIEVKTGRNHSVHERDPLFLLKKGGLTLGKPTNRRQGEVPSPSNPSERGGKGKEFAGKRAQRKNSEFSSLTDRKKGYSFPVYFEKK